MFEMPGGHRSRKRSRSTYGLRRHVALLQTHASDLLATWGLLRPSVLLPAHAREWSDDRIRIVLCHELAHIRRNDWFVQIAAEALRSLFWFNPLIWIACTRLRRESEQACDDVVLDSTSRPGICRPPAGSRQEVPEANIAHGHRRCRWLVRQRSKGESPPCSTRLQSGHTFAPVDHPHRAAAPRDHRANGSLSGRSELAPPR